MASPSLPFDRCVRFVMSLWPPFVNSKPPAASGWLVQLFRVLQQKLGFCYEYVEAPDGFWGSELPNGSWIGMMGMLQRKEVDLALGPFAVSLQRSTVADFSVPILSTDHTIFYTRPRVSPDLLGFVKPFAVSVWSFLALTLVLVSTIALVLHSLSLKRLVGRDDGSKFEAAADEGHERGRGRLSRAQRPTPVRESWLWGFMILVGQVLDLRLVGLGERTSVAVWMLASFILAAVYKGNLKAMLIVPKVEVPFDSLEELASQDEVPWVMGKGTLVNSFFQASHEEDPDSTMGQVWARKNFMITKPSTVIPITLEGNAGLFVRYTSTYRMSKDFSKHGWCRFAITRSGFMSVSYSMGFPKKSTLKPIIDNLIYRLKEAGILEKFMQEGLGNATRCLKPLGSKQYSALRSLVIEDFLGIFSFYAAGMVIGIMLFFMELVQHRLIQNASN